MHDDKPTADSSGVDPSKVHGTREEWVAATQRESVRRIEAEAMVSRLVRCFEGYHVDTCNAFGSGIADEDLRPEGPDPHCDCGDAEMRNLARALLRPATPFTSLDQEKK